HRSQHYRVLAPMGLDVRPQQSGAADYVIIDKENQFAARRAQAGVSRGGQPAIVLFQAAEIGCFKSRQKTGGAIGGTIVYYYDFVLIVGKFLAKEGCKGTGE